VGHASRTQMTGACRRRTFRILRADSPTNRTELSARSRNGFLNRPTAGHSTIRDAISLAMIVICVLLSGCQDVRTIWSAEARSPDGYWLASARTIEHSGPGTAGRESSVYLKRVQDSSPPLTILGFFHHENDPSTEINLAMKWVSATHLEVTYNGRAASLEFQAVKFDGVEISVRDISGEAVDTPHHP
jgi:hypothetical protein